MKELQQGEVLMKVTNHGQTILSTEMLLLPQARLKLQYDDAHDYIKMTVSDTSLDSPELSGEIDLGTLEDYIKALKKMYIQLKNQ